ncbi:MAG: glycosyltransferase [Polyangiales bacterium]
MRVSHIIAPGLMAGAENVVLQGCAALVAKGHEVRLLVIVDDRCPQYGEQLIAAAQAKGVPVEPLRARGRFDVRSIVHLRQKLRAQGAELVHAHGYKALVYSIFARSKRSSLVVTHHGETGHDRLARLYEGLARSLYARVDLVFAVSNATTEALVAAGVPRSKLRTVPNPVSLPAPGSEAGSPPSEGALLFLGRLSEEKGLDVLLRALATPRAPKELSLDVAGDGPCADQWKALSTELGLENRVRWLGVRRDVPELLSKAEALVLPSRREGLPLVILEAAASEVPVVASRVGGVPEAVWEGENAILVAPDDVEAWSIALESLPSQRTTLREGAHRRGPEVRLRHSPESWAALTTQHYHEVANA